jgi:hypothetical protein
MRRSAHCVSALRPALCPTLATLATLVTGAPRLAAADPDDIVGLPSRPRHGQLWLDATLELNVSHQRGGSKALAPDLWWGLTDDTTLAIAHSARSLARIDDLGGLCFARCSERPRYATALLAKHALAATDELDVSLLSGALLRDIDPWKPALLAGTAAHWHRGRWAAAAMPYLQLGVADTGSGNRARLVVPLRAWVQPACAWALSLHSGVEGELAVFSEAYHVPLAAQVSARLTTTSLITLEAGFSSLLGPQNTGNRRFATLSLQTRL